MKNEKSNFVVKSIKFNSDEYSKVEKILNDKNVKFATYVKSLIFKTPIKNKKLEISIQNANSYKEKIYQLKKMGNNLNQIAKTCNQNKSVDYFMLKEISEIKELLKRLENGS